MLRPMVLILLVVVQSAMASWLRVGISDAIQSNGLHAKVRLALPDRSWTWEGQLSPAEGMISGVLISEPIWVPDGASGAITAEVVCSDAVYTQDIQIPSGMPSQWFLDLGPQGKRPYEERSVSARDVSPRVSPNPFNLTTRISLNLVERADADLRIVDILGRTALVIHSGSLEAGSHGWTLDARSLASGTYFLSYRLSPGSTGATRLLLLK